MAQTQLPHRSGTGGSLGSDDEAVPEIDASEVGRLKIFFVGGRVVGCCCCLGLLGYWVFWRGKGGETREVLSI